MVQFSSIGGGLGPSTWFQNCSRYLRNYFHLNKNPRFFNVHPATQVLHHIVFINEKKWKNVNNSLHLIRLIATKKKHQ